MERKVHWVSETKDTKTGPVVASYSPKDTCPDTCSLKDGGCYAWGLFYLNVLGKKIADGRIKVQNLTDALAGRRVSAKIARHRIAGDVVGDVESTIEECRQIEEAGLINIAYTHTWRSPASSPLKKWFRASCQTVEEVMEARNAGWAATLIVEGPEDVMDSLPNGERTYVCPAQRNPGKVTCNTCTLCKVTPQTSGKTVVFLAHGSAGTMKKIRGKVAASVEV
jgi:hypothetical protein